LPYGGYVEMKISPSEYCYRFIDAIDSKSTKWIAWYDGQVQLNYLYTVRNTYRTLQWKNITFEEIRRRNKEAEDNSVDN
jgi:hypothetical protein